MSQPLCHVNPLLTSVKRVRDKYEMELSELEQSERKLQERCTELKGRLGDVEGEKERLQALVRQKEKELEDVRAVSSPSPLPHPDPPTPYCWPAHRLLPRR